MGSIGDIKFGIEFNKCIESTNSIIVKHEISFETFEKTCNDFIHLRTNSALAKLEQACSNYMVFLNLNSFMSLISLYHDTILTNFLLFS